MSSKNITEKFINKMSSSVRKIWNSISILKPRLFPWKSNRFLLSFPESQITFALVFYTKYHISVASTQPRTCLKIHEKKSAVIFACCCIIFSAKTQQYFFCHSFRWGCLLAWVSFFLKIVFNKLWWIKINIMFLTYI